MKVKELLNSNPLSKELIRQWFLKQRTESTNNSKDIPEEFKKAFIEIGVNDQMLILYIGNNPHCLFEIFDENNLFISIFKSKENIGYKINNLVGYTEEFKTRKETEYEAISDCLILLEAKLKSNITNG